MFVTATTQAGTGFGQRPQPLPAHRAPVAVEAQSDARPTRVPRTALMPDAAIVAHLWAVRENAPQTRARRRAAPQAAGEAYARAQSLKNAPREPVSNFA